MARRQCCKLHAPAGEERVGADEEGVGPLAHEGAEGRIDLAAGAGVEDLDLQPEARAAASNLSNVVSVAVALAGLTSTATRAAPGTSSRRSSSRFAANSWLKKLIPVSIAARPGEAGDKTELDRVFGRRRRRSGSSWSPPWPPAREHWPHAAITATCRRTSSAASSGNRSY